MLSPRSEPPRRLTFALFMEGAASSQTSTILTSNTARRSLVARRLPPPEYLDLYDTTLNASPHSRSPSTFLSNSSADELSLPFLRTCVTYLSNLSTRTQLGICSNTPQEGINTLKRWTEELELRKGLLIGLDENGVAVDTR